MLDTRTVFDRDGLQIADVVCRHERGKGAVEEAPMHGIGFVRQGCFVRNAGGAERTLDPSTVFFVNPGEEQRYDHPHRGGDDCTALSLGADLVASIWGGDPTLPREPFHSPPRLDLEHRLLLAGARRGEDLDELGEWAILVVANALECCDGSRAQSGRPASSRDRRALVEEAREALAADPDLSLPALARLLATSPHHLSRLFRSFTGHTISRHRMRLRARAVLERLAAGDRNLARLAAEIGFADQSHLCRV
ncbi:MAG TPA: helix-turn-helix transcriptional regulator, partial [Solirubrobacterales bacterium]